MLIIPQIPAHEWVDSPERGTQILRSALKRGYVALDTETTGVHKTKSKVVDWSLAFNDAHGSAARYCLSSRLLPLFLPLFQSEDVAKVMHNAKFDLHMLANMGIRIEGEIHDTFVMSILQNTERGVHSLKYLSGEGLFPKDDPRHLDYEAPFGKKIKIENYVDLQKKIGEDKAREYSSLDAIATLLVYEELKRLLEETEAWEGSNLWELFLKEEVPFTRVLFNCERRGICVDVGYLEEQAAKAEEALEALAESFCRSASRPLNLNSPKQLREFFYDHLNKQPLNYTAGGASGNKQPSLDAKTLEVWSKNGDPYAKTLLEYRKLKKLHGTYLKGLLKQADPDDCRVHSSLNQGGTETGRISSSNPNLQNIPRASGDIYEIRSSFVAPVGKMLIDADYDQLEMKLMADMADEKAMIQAINSGKDLHSSTAALMYNVAYDAVAAAKRRKDAGKHLSDADKTLCGYRQNAKTIGFGLNYGQGPAKLGQQLGINVQQAKDLIELYFQPYPNVHGFIAEVHEYVTQTGYVRTLSGRARHLRDGVDSDDHGMYAQALRRAVNAVIQGSAADVVRKAMVLCENDERLHELDCQLLLQIHDELLFECPEGNVKEAMPIIQELMVAPYAGELKVTLTADPHYGYTWMQAK